MTEVFTPANPAFPSVSIGVTSVPQVFRLESAFADFDRKDGRVVRLASCCPIDFCVAFGGDDVPVTAANGMLVLGGTVEAFGVGENETHMAIVSTEPTTVNVTIGYGA